MIGKPEHLINSDDISGKGYKWMMRDDPIILKGELPHEPIIYNLDSITGNGTHWICIYDDGKYIFHYNPLGGIIRGQKPKKEIRNYAKRLGRTIISNPYNHQPIRSNLCGHFSLYMANQFNKNKPMTPEKYKNILLKSFGYDSDMGDVKKVLG